MGAFDDLIPKGAAPSSPQGGSAFADLIPGPKPSSSLADRLRADRAGTPEPIAAPPPLTERQMFDSAFADLIPQGDHSTAGGDVEAGALMLSQGLLGGIPALAAADNLAFRMNRAQSIQDRSADQLSNLDEIYNGNLDPRRRAQLEALANERSSEAEAELPALMPDLVASLMGTLPDIMDRQAQIEAIPVNPSAQKLMNLEGGILENIPNAMEAISEDPYGVLRTTILRSLPASAPSILAAVGGQALAGPGGAATGAAAGEFVTEAGISAAQEIAQTLQKAGVDWRDEAAIQTFITENPDAMREVVTTSLQRAGIISVTGAVSAGIGGRLARNAVGGTNRAGSVAGALAVEPTMEGVGEALAGGTPGDVFAEVLGGAGQGAIQTAGQLAVEAVRASRSPRPAPTSGTAPAPTVPLVDQTPPAAPVAPETAPQMANPAPIAPQPAPVAPVAPQPNAPVEPVPVVAPATPKVGMAQSAMPTIPPSPVDTPKRTKRTAPPRKYPVMSSTFSFARTGGQGINPDGPAGKELIAAGVTPKKFPFLYSQKGVDDVDALVVDEYPGLQEIIKSTDPDQPGGGYFDRDDVLNAIIEEANGQPRRTAAEIEQLVAAGQIAQDYNFTVPATPTEVTEPGDGGFFIIAPENDISTPAERRSWTEMMVNGYITDQGLAEGTFSPDEITSMVEDLIETGGSVEAMVDWRMINDIEYGNSDTPDAFEDIPFPDAPESGSGVSQAQPDTRTGAPVEANTGDAGRDGPQGAVGSDQRQATGSEATGIEGAAPARSDGSDTPAQRSGQPAAQAQPARTGTEEGGSVDLTPEGRQLVIPGAEQIGDGERARRAQAKPMQGGDAPPAEGGLFSPPGPDMFEDQVEVGDGRNAKRQFDDRSKPDDDAGMDQDTVSLNTSGKEEVIFDPSDDGSDMKDVTPQQKRITESEATAAPPKPKKQGGRQPKGSLAPTFTAFSFTDKNSVYEAAFRAAGLDPNAARLKSVDDQIQILKGVLLRDFGVKVELPQRMIKRKTITGRSVKESRERISPRDGIDQMLDAYRQFQMMTHVFGLPHKAVGLMENGNAGQGITLSLTNRLPGALGSYSYSPDGGERVITLPGRSNSFAHEWGHALDHYLSRLIWTGEDGPRLLTSRELWSEGLTDQTRKEELATVFAQVLRDMFGDRAAIAAMQIDLQAQSTEVNRKGNPTIKAKKAKKALADIEVGKKLPPEITSQYFKNVKDFDDMFGGDGYFTDPAEMFARSIETYVGIKARQVSDLPTSFLAKPDWAYSSSEETRSKMTFPRGTDAEVIFSSIDRLMGAVRRHGVFGDGKAKAPADTDIADPRKWDRFRPKGGMIEQEAAAWRQAKRQQTAIEKAHPTSQRVGDVVSMVANSFGAHMHRVVNRQPKAAQAPLRQIVDMFSTDPGSGRKIAQVWEEAVEAQTGRTLNRYENIIKQYELDAGDVDQMAELRRLLTVPDAKTADPKLREAAAELRRLMDAEWRYVSEAGVKVGYVRNGWLPRLPEMDAISQDQDGFLAKAKKVYKIVFQNDVRSGDIDEEISDLRRVLNRLKRDTKPDGEGGRYTIDRIPASDEAQIDEWRQSLNALRRAQKKLDQANADGDGDKIAAAEGKVAEAMDAYQEHHENMLDLMEDLWADMAAEHWLTRIMTGAPNDFDSRGPSETFTKKRTLPPEADDIMAEYYQANPLELIENYIHMAARRAEYVRRAGDGSQKIENLLEKAARDGADARDIREVRNMIKIMAGRDTSNASSALSHVGGWAYVTATIALLNKATFSSLAESLVLGLRTGRVRDAFRATALTIGQALPTASAQERTDVARIIGLVRSAYNETVMMNRYGGDVDPNQAQARMTSNFFRNIGLTALTNAQRKAAMSIGSDHLARMLRIVSGKQTSWLGITKTHAKEELSDMGVPEQHYDALLSWIEEAGGMPGPDDLMGVDGDYYNDAAALWANAISRFVNTTIQNPRKYTRPMAAQMPGLRIAYGITGFIFSFHREVLARLFKAGVEGRRDGEGRAKAAGRQALGAGLNIARVAPAVAALYTGHLLTTALREALFNQDEWEKQEKEGTLEEWLAKRAFSRTGLTGAFDIPLNLATGIRYERDIASAYAGPHIGYWLENVEAAMKIGGLGRNSPNTFTTERAAAQKLLDTAWSVGGGMAISTLPGGPLLRPVYGGAMYGMEAFSPAELIED